MEILALIPARGGSKGISNKNIRPFCGKPLIAYTIDAAKASPKVGRVVVSTDSEEIAATGRECGAESFMRPAATATDTAPVMDAVLYTLDKLRDTEGYEPTHVLLLQTTSPLRETSDIDNAVELLQKRDADSVISMCRTEQGLFTKNSEDAIETLHDGYKTGSNRQTLTPTYKLDGCMIYLIKTDVLRTTRSFLGGKAVGYEIERWRAVDLDEPQDFVLAELIYQNRAALKERIKNFY